jgi:hypothetical protein
VAVAEAATVAVPAAKEDAAVIKGERMSESFPISVFPLKQFSVFTFHISV